jgi:predicted DCC family thiol-disulfide oxidoreductase YuxK
MSKITVIYDGQCEFCKQSVQWVRAKLPIEAVSYQSADLNKFGLSNQECEQSVQVIFEGNKYKSAEAVALLLKLRGNKFLFLLVSSSGRFGDYAYYWVARNRSKIIVKLVSKLIFR